MIKIKYVTILIVLVVALIGVTMLMAVSKPKKTQEVTMTSIAYDNSKYDSAIFAGGCFWCMTPPFENLEGVQKVVTGYSGGHTKNPTYEEVCSGTTGYLESVFVIYDPKKVAYTQLLDAFWKNIDPTDTGGQFADRGHQYKTAIFYQNNEQKRLAQLSKEELQKSGIYKGLIVTSIQPFTNFYPAEDYHQDYYKKNPTRYKNYAEGSGREQYIKSVWGSGKTFKTEVTQESSSSRYSKPSEKEMKEKLTPIQYQVTQQCGTEPPFQNEYWNNHREGIYVDVVTGEPLFTSLDKFDSGTGWPSFTKPIEKNAVTTDTDTSYNMKRTEVKSKSGNSHLGHIFDDGPQPTGLRYCINSASLRFIPKENLEKEGYGEYLKLFKK